MTKNFVRSLLGPTMGLQEAIWTKLNWAWAGFFLVAGALNLGVAFTTTTTTWVSFKVFGLIGLTLVFALGIGAWMSRHMQEAPDVR